MFNIEAIKQIQYRGNYGIEREGLRSDEEGRLAMTPHPEVFGEKLFNPYITTDFSESQLELITPVFDTSKETHSFLEGLYDITIAQLKDEYIWPESMPCLLPEEKEIPIANFCECEEGRQAHKYRKKLFKKYGGKKQLVSGIHYNFSFDDSFLRQLYALEKTEETYKQFKNKVYLKVARNYLRYRWLLIYLLGSTSVMHETYEKKCIDQLEDIGGEGYSNRGALSYRNSECGYGNKEALYPNYETIQTYIESIKHFVENRQIESHKELYSQIRLKTADNKAFLESLEKDGVAYLEYRSIDINPFDKAGIKLSDLEFLEVFNLFLLLEEESEYATWQEEAQSNQNAIAKFGQQEIMLLKDGELISKEAWGVEILESVKVLDFHFELGRQNIIEDIIEKMKNHKKTYAYQLLKKVKQEGYIEAHMALAKAYKEESMRKTYQFKGFEDLELSTQILMREAIKRGIKTDVIDRSENFIRLKRGSHIEYVKQATKTSKDNYVTVLIMENKTVTKEVLQKSDIRVPEGKSFDTLTQATYGKLEFIGKPVVVKPKSTNFGIGISIFPEGANEEDLQKAIEIGFEHDQTILIEEFIQGKEYRFLVIDNEVVGILHRVPANVTGDGTRTIEELIQIKNQDPLRGKGYKTPLEKIQIDESLKLFLKQNDYEVTSIPKDGEIVYLRENSNISTGGDSIDYTDEIPERFKQIAIQSAQAVDAKICGVDMMIYDYTDETSDYGIIELNFNPAIHIHTYPYKGKNRKPAEALLKLLGYIN